MVELHLELTDSLATLLHSTTNLCQETDWGGLRFGEDVDVICGHTLLRNEDLLRTIDDEVSSRIVRTFIQVKEFLVTQLVEDAIR